jgi:hypothetical protein
VICAFTFGIGLQAAVGDRLTGLDREAVGTGGEALFSPLDRLQAAAQIAFLARGELVFVEVLVVEVACRDVRGRLLAAVAAQRGQTRFDPLPLGRDQLFGAFLIHSVPPYPPPDPVSSQFASLCAAKCELKVGLRSGRWSAILLGD